MTDNEIIKALAYCCLDTDEKALIDKSERCREDLCYRAALQESRMDATTCSQRLIEDSLDLIYRQKVEIGRLEHIHKGDEQLINSLNKCYKLAKSEAIKEFAERLKSEYEDEKQGRYIDWLMSDIIDNLVKEMTEVKENERKSNDL